MITSNNFLTTSSTTSKYEFIKTMISLPMIITPISTDSDQALEIDLGILKKNQKGKISIYI